MFLEAKQQQQRYYQVFKRYKLTSKLWIMYLEGNLQQGKAFGDIIWS